MQSKEFVIEQAIKWLQSKIKRATHKDKEQIRSIISLLEEKNGHKF